MNDPPARGHPLDAPGGDDAFIAGGIPVSDISFKNNGDRLESAVWMWAERKAVIIFYVVLRAMMIQEEKRIDPLQARHRHGTKGYEIGDVIVFGVDNVLNNFLHRVSFSKIF
jgi:hypothetical protein